jgi:prolyl oligopeptidase
MIPPSTGRDTVADTLHGVAVTDPYRWLEDGDDPHVQHWVAEQNRYTRSALDAIPSRGAWHERLVALMGLPVVLAAEVRGERVILLEREPGAQQARLVARDLDDPSSVTVLADPAAGSDDAAIAIDWFYASPDGGSVAYGVSEGGTERSALRVVATVDGVHRADEIPNCRGCSLGWEPDGSGFVYTRYPDGDEYRRLAYHHRLGDDWRDDPLVWAGELTDQMWTSLAISPDGRFVLVSVEVGWSRTDLFVVDRDTGAERVMCHGAPAINNGWTFLDATTLIGVTTLDAPKGRLVTVPVGQPGGVGPSTWVTLVPEGDDVMERVAVAADGCYLVSTRVGVDRLEHVSLSGERQTVTGIDLLSIVGVDADRRSGAVIAVAAGFDTPGSLMRVAGDAATQVHPALDRAIVADLEVSQLHYPSLDGTMVPIFLIHRAGHMPTAGTRAILNGYGGFAIAEKPLWSPTIAAWCATGGLYAIAGLRGGTEYGEEWHRAGARQHKQNVFDDFHAAAEWLVSTGRTSPERLAIAGGSNGGLLVGAALTQRPDLFRAVWCAVPLLDMIRFPRFLIARLWTTEYGDPEIAEEFAWLWAYSPYHRVVDGSAYPAVLFTTAEGDTRVDPLHARKMAARLQEAQGNAERPVLLIQEGRAGHGQGKPTGKRAAEQADVLAFFDWQLEP